ncbi:DUF29 domain-containing protein [Pseudanabaena biceps]|nr:DUF29 domain-containing protein [Pseudanabaena biceps]
MSTTTETKSSVASEELRSLYNSDFAIWVEETAKHLQNRNFEHIDLENLIEEVLDLSRRDQKKLKSLLKRLFEHLLKLRYWQSEVTRNQSHWKREILNFRQQIKDELEDSPSLRPFLKKVFDECYQDGRKLAATATDLPLDIFPETAIASLDQILDENWFL